MILVDTNVLLDVVENDPTWADWSQQQLEAASLREQLCINPVIYAELSMAFNRIEEVEQVVHEGQLLVEPLPREALFLAGKVFLQYRKRGGAKTGVLPDFFIGAHAAIAGMNILTRDAGRYRTYFPRTVLICPE
jgi:predicted nucleic acid-binding protein